MSADPKTIDNAISNGFTPRQESESAIQQLRQTGDNRPPKPINSPRKGEQEPSPWGEGGAAHTTQYAYDEDNRVTSVTSGLATENYNYDGLGRMDRITTVSDGETVLTREYTFTATQIATNHIQATVGIGTGATGYDDPDPYTYGVTYSYTYDDNGNILSISDGTYTTSYAYDSANQLIRENNQQLGFTRTWAYDNAGNILCRREYAYTTGNLENLVPTDVVSYSYSTSDLGDLLVEYDGTEITHDAIGNPLYDGQWTYTWEHGRELSAMSDGGYSNWTFTYDANGMRTQRTDGYYTYSYIYNGSQLSRMTVVYDDGEHYEYHELTFAYSADGTPLSVTYCDCTYYYVTNIQGDVIAILDDIGRLVCRYAYDAWGNVTICDERPDNVSWYNPLRYRGYVYDWETNLYYLQSRYYSPKLCRFLNADALVSTGQGPIGNNMFAYCGNNPTTNSDPFGKWTIGISVGANLTAILGVSISIGVYWDDNGNVDWQWSYSVPGVGDTMSVGLLDVGGSLAIQYTNADTVYDLYGPTTYVGASGGPSWYVGADTIHFRHASDPIGSIDGFQIVGGIGLGADVHVTETYTKPVGKQERTATAYVDVGQPKWYYYYNHSLR